MVGQQGKTSPRVKLRDNDATGIKKGAQVQSICAKLQFPCLVIDPVAIYPDIPDKGDIREILETMDIEEFIRRLEAEIHNAATKEIKENTIYSQYSHAHAQEKEVPLSYNSSIDGCIPDTAPIALQNFVQKAEAALYASGHWVSIGGQLYHHVGSHYELQSEEIRKNAVSVTG